MPRRTFTGRAPSITLLQRTWFEKTRLGAEPQHVNRVKAKAEGAVREAKATKKYTSFTVDCHLRTLAANEQTVVIPNLEAVDREKVHLITGQEPHQSPNTLIGLPNLFLDREVYDEVLLSQFTVVDDSTINTTNQTAIASPDANIPTLVFWRISVAFTADYIAYASLQYYRHHHSDHFMIRRYRRYLRFEHCWADLRGGQYYHVRHCEAYTIPWVSQR